MVNNYIFLPKLTFPVFSTTGLGDAIKRFSPISSIRHAARSCVSMILDLGNLEDRNHGL